MQGRKAALYCYLSVLLVSSSFKHVPSCGLRYLFTALSATTSSDHIITNKVPNHPYSGHEQDCHMHLNTSEVLFSKVYECLHVSCIAHTILSGPCFDVLFAQYVSHDMDHC